MCYKKVEDDEKVQFKLQTDAEKLWNSITILLHTQASASDSLSIRRIFQDCF